MVIKKIQAIEEEYSVDKIIFNNEQVWPVLRIYITGLLLQQEDKIARNQKLSVKKIIGFLGNLTRGLTKLLWGDFDYLYFSKAERRKYINGEYHERVIEGAMSLFSINSLLIESPIPTSHYSSKEVATKNLASESLLYLIQGISIIFMRKGDYKGVDIVKNIENEYNLTVNYHYIYKRFRAQYLSMKWLLKNKNVKGAFFVAPYLYMGYVKAFKEQHIPVVEFQHGVINEMHFAYNSFHTIKTNLLPDYLLTFGQETKTLLSNSKQYISAPKIIPVGNYFLEAVENSPMFDIKLEEIKLKFNKSIAVSGQEIIEDELMPFLKDCAIIDETILIIYVPRSLKDYSSFDLPENVIICDWLNIYQVILLCDIHSTFNSSCALEAPLLGKQNILIDFNKQASAYYGEILSNKQVTKFVTTPVEFIKIAQSFPYLAPLNIKQSVSNMIKPNYQDNMKNFFKTYLGIKND